MQGDPLSSVLFKLFLSDFDKEMKKISTPKISLYNTKLEIAYLQFVDDIALLADNHLYLQKLINITQEYFISNRLKINENKTKTVIFRKGGIPKKHDVYYLNNQKLEIVQAYKYLGVNFQSTGKFHVTAKEVVNKSKQKINAI